jgi:hypothetical protein
MKKLLISFVCLLPMMLSCQKNEITVAPPSVTVESLVSSKEFTDLGNASLAFTFDLIDKSNTAPLFKSKLNDAIKQNDSDAIITTLGFENNAKFLEVQKAMVNKLEKVYLTFPDLRNRADKNVLLEEAFSRYTETSMRNAKTAGARSNCLGKAAAKFGGKLFVGMVTMSAPTGITQIAGAVGIAIATMELADAIEVCEKLSDK